MHKWLAALIVLLACACQPQLPQIAALPADAVILAFGDSLTYGTGASAAHDYPSLLAGLSGREVINEGVPGETSAEGLKRLPDLLDNIQPNLLILIHGGNDILKKIPGEQTERNLEAMIVAAKNRHISVLLMGVPKPGLLLMQSAPFYQALAKRHVVLADLETLPDVLGKSSLKSDLVHPNDAGYRQIAENIDRLLQAAGAY